MCVCPCLYMNARLHCNPARVRVSFRNRTHQSVALFACLRLHILNYSNPSLTATPERTSGALKGQIYALCEGLQNIGSVKHCGQVTQNRCTHKSMTSTKAWNTYHVM